MQFSLLGTLPRYLGYSNPPLELKVYTSLGAYELSSYVGGSLLDSELVAQQGMVQSHVSASADLGFRVLGLRV